MSRRRLTRVLVALAVPALTVPALATSATAAGKGPDVPSLERVAKIYPHLDGGTAQVSDIAKVAGPGKNCKPGKPIPGARGTAASYTAAGPAGYETTGDKPGLYVSALRFKTPKSAIAYLHDSSTSTKKCPVGPGSGDDVKVKVKKIRFKLGDERWGYTAEMTMDDVTYISHSLLVREGKFIVSAGAYSTDGTEPSVKKALKLTKLALTTAS